MIEEWYSICTLFGGSRLIPNSVQFELCVAAAWAKSECDVCVCPITRNWRCLVCFHTIKQQPIVSFHAQQSVTVILARPEMKWKQRGLFGWCSALELTNSFASGPSGY